MKPDRQPRKTLLEILDIVDNIECMDYQFKVAPREGGFLLQVRYYEADIEKPEGSPKELQLGRKWYISPYSTETEIVRTVYKAIQTSLEHRLGEHFTYKRDRIYSPHISVAARSEMCDKLDVRIPPFESKPPTKKESR